MAEHYPVIVERENNGTFSAWVAGLPGVYAATDTVAAAKRGIRSALAAHLDAQTALRQNAKLRPRDDRPTHEAAPRTAAPASRVPRVIGLSMPVKKTLNINDSALQRLREEAARRGTTMSALVATGLRRVLATPDAPAEQPKALPPLPTWNSGGHLVNIDDRDALYRAME